MTDLDRLRQRLEQLSTEPTEAQLERRAQWVVALGQLMDEITGLLEPLVIERLLTVERVDFEVDDGPGGIHTVPGLRLTTEAGHELEVRPEDGRVFLAPGAGPGTLPLDCQFRYFQEGGASVTYDTQAFLKSLGYMLTDC